MESLRQPIDYIGLAREDMSSECLEPEAVATGSALEMADESENLISHHRHRQMPFLQLLQGAMRAGDETEEEEDRLQQQHQALFATYPQQESHIQLLLRLQSECAQKNWTAKIEPARATEQLESCVTQASESQSVAKKVQRHHYHHRPQLPVAAEGPTRERRKRKRPRAASAAAVSRSTVEAESQRMTHIAVERNRRRLMNDHLAALRALMPPSFVQRGDQASIVGGAIDFVKELEQLLLSLQAEKRLRTSPAVAADPSCHVETAPAVTSLDGFFVSPQYRSYSKWQQHRRHDGGAQVEEEEEEVGVDVEATVVQGHVNLKVYGRRRPGQLVRAIAAMEELRLSVLHLNVTSLHCDSILYSFNLKMEEDCKLGSGDEIASAVHQIFGYINACRCCC